MFQYSCDADIVLVPYVGFDDGLAVGVWCAVFEPQVWCSVELAVDVRCCYVAVAVRLQGCYERSCAMVLDRYLCVPARQHRRQRERVVSFGRVDLGEVGHVAAEGLIHSMTMLWLPPPTLNALPIE